MKQTWMKKGLALILCLAMSAGFLLPAAASEVRSDPFLDTMNEKFREPEMEYRPEARWWLAEGSHTDETLIESIHELYDSGFGALEFLTLDESAFLDNETYAWGSEEWIHDSHLIMREATKLGMGVSFTSGTHWSTANLMNITPDDETASQELSYRTVELSAGASFEGELPVPALPENVTKAKFVALVAAKRTAEGSMVLVEDSLTDVTQLAWEENGVWSAKYTAPADGDYILFAFWQHGTGENYQPAVTGKSFTINYFDKAGAEALIEYWDAHVLDEEMKALIRENGDVSMYMDSLEVKTKGANSTNNNWAADFPQEFETRTGYSLIKYLPILIMTNPGGWGANVAYAYELEGEELLAAKIRRDLFQCGFVNKCGVKLLPKYT